METTRFRADQTDDPVAAARACAEAAKLLLAGEIVALPTETLYGVGVRADDPAAMERLRQVRGREEGKPFPIVFSDAELALGAGDRISSAARRLADRFWPGPLTLVVSLADGGSLGIRVPGSDLTRAVLRGVGVPVALPSANPATNPPARNADEVLAYFNGKIAGVLDGGRAPIGTPSTVVDVRGESPHIVREGFLSAQEIRRAAALGVLFVCSGNTCRSPMAETLARDLLARRLGVATDGLVEAGFRVASAGMYAGPGQPASDGARYAMDSRSLDLTPHRSQPLTAQLLSQQDRIYAMTQSLVEVLKEVAPDPSRVRHIDPLGRDVVDPFGGTIGVYERCASEIEEKLHPIVDDLLTP